MFTLAIYTAAGPGVCLRRRLPGTFATASDAAAAGVAYLRQHPAAVGFEIEPPGLQAANDAGNLDDIREFTTPEVFAEIKLSLAERGGAKQETDVVTIDADVLEVVEEPARYIVSVRFTGLLREEKDAPATPIDEVWHLVKPREGQGGWLLAGIQQMQ